MVHIKEFGITSDATLYKIAKDLNIKLNWIGFEHLLHNQKYQDGGYILNIGDDTGSHWTCLNVLNDTVFYFDSFAVPPNNEIFHWAEKNKVERLSWNNKEQFQKLNQDLCGLWCIVALYYLQKKQGSLNERFNQMSRDI
jgi:hypothetical protein